MGKVKVKKSDVWIDMTPMSDVMTLLLTFFMLTSTFVKNEPVKVMTPGSISEIKVPENGVLTIVVSPEMDAKGTPTGEGQVFMSIDNTDQLGRTLDEMASIFSVNLTPKQIETFKTEAMFGVPIDELSSYLQMNSQNRAKYITTKGIPLDSIDGGMSQFQQWVNAARTVNQDIKIALKADAKTPYKTVKKVMNDMRKERGTTMAENIIATWRTPGVFKADAQKVCDELQEIGEEFTPEDIVEAAEDEDKELHKCFEWDDTKAAHKYRIHQAVILTSQLVFRRDIPDKEPPPAPVRVFNKTDSAGGYKIPERTFKVQ
ncbi:MAG: biopolymer transporter ExbD, partial [Prevotella sp.]|nr:biopolymer transporter ExbD [Prevotella sp.]